MDEIQIKEALQNLSVTLEGKNKTEIAASMSEFEQKMNDAFSAEITNEKANFDSELEAVKAGLIEDIKKVQDYADALDVKLQKKGTKEGEPVDALKDLIRDNFDQIKTVRKGQAFETKVVGNMTLGTSLTGDQPRVYSPNLAMIPSHLVNFSQLVGNINIDGGTYTFPRESGQEGAPATQTEGSDKAQMDYDYTMVDVNTDFLAGFAVYSKKMANNLPFLESFLPRQLRRDYFKAENDLFYADLVTNSTASGIITGNIVERIVAEQTFLLSTGYVANIIVVNPADYGSILVTAGTDGTGAYSLPGIVTISNGNVTINGIQVIPVSWCPADLYIIGDWSECEKVTTQGLSVNFFDQDSDNVRKNNITARVEAQIGLAVYRTDAFINGDFTAVA